jgi:hypothetical protein
VPLLILLEVSRSELARLVRQEVTSTSLEETPQLLQLVV